MQKILGDCRDIAIHRLLLTFNATLERVGEMLMERASRTDVREEQVASLEARDTLQTGRTGLMAEFERRLRVADLVIKFLTVRIDETLKRLEKRKRSRDKRAHRKATAAPAPAQPSVAQQMLGEPAPVE